MQQPKKIFDLFLFIPFILVFTTVFIVNDELANRVISGKYFWYYGAMGLTCLVAPIIVLKKKGSYRFNLSDQFMILFGGSILISALLINHSENWTKIILLVLLIILYYQFRIVLNRYKQAGRWFFLTLVLTGLAEAIWGLKQLYGLEASNHSLFKITGSFFNPGPYTGYLSVIFPLALSKTISFLKMDHQLKSLFLTKKLIVYLIGLIAFFTTVTIILIIPAAMSRASWIALLTGSGCVLLLNSTNNAKTKVYVQKNKQKIIFASIFAGIILTGLFVGMYFLKKDSADGRALIWKVSIQAITKHPFGVGLGNFAGAYGDAQANYFQSGFGSRTEQLVAGSPEYGFNEYLQILIESGIISFLLFTLLMGISIHKAFRHKKYGECGALVSILTFALFSYPFSVLPLLIVLVFLLSTCNTQPFEHQVRKSTKDISKTLVRDLCLSFTCIGIVATCIINRYPTYSAYKSWNKVKVFYHMDLYENSSKDYAQLYPYLNDQISFLFEYAQSLSKKGQYKESNLVLQRAMQISCDPMLYNICGKNHQALRNFKRAETCYIKAYNLAPNRLYPYYLLAKLYKKTGEHQRAKKTAYLLLQKKPKVPSIAIKEMKEEMKRIVAN